MLFIKKILLILLLACAVGLPAAEYDFTAEKFNAAIAAAEKGGLPVVVVNISSIDYILPVRKNILKRKDFMARNGKDFQFFLLDTTAIDVFEQLSRQVKGDAITVYHADSYHDGSVYFNGLKGEEYCAETLKMLRPRHAIHKYSGSNSARRVYKDWKAGKLNINEYDRDGKHVFHAFIENVYPGFYIENDIFIEMIEYLSKQNLPKDFWSYTLLLHTWQLPRYDAEKPNGRYRTLQEWCDITDILVKAGADPNYADDYGISTAFVYFRCTAHVGTTGERYNTKARFFAPAAMW